jgi:PhzF family phenazine biosynthesis protein
MLIPVATQADLAAMTPDLNRLREACDHLGLLGCYLYSTPAGDGRVAARMFAPSIGVPEDIANANSTACLAAYLAHQGVAALTVDMGDSLGAPATITATATPGPAGLLVRVGGFTASLPFSDSSPASAA